MAENDDLPPLDDVSDVSVPKPLSDAPSLSSSSAVRHDAAANARIASAATAALSTRLASKHDIVEEVEEGEALQDQLMRAALGKTVDAEAEKAHAAKQAAITKDFGKGGGFKKGFLLGGAKAAAGSPKSSAAAASGSSASPKPSLAPAGAAGTSSSSSAADIPVLKPTAKGDSSSSLRLPEVQEAMRAGTGALQRTLSDTKSELQIRWRRRYYLVAPRRSINWCYKCLAFVLSAALILLTQSLLIAVAAVRCHPLIPILLHVQRG